MKHLIAAAIVTFAIGVASSGCGQSSVPAAASATAPVATSLPELPSPRSAAPSASAAGSSGAPPAAIDARIAVGMEPAHLALAAGALWITNGDQTVTRVDPASGTVTGTTVLPGIPGGVAGESAIQGHAVELMSRLTVLLAPRSG